MVDDLGVLAVDGDLARLALLWDLAHQADMQQAVLERSGGDLDGIGQVEAALAFETVANRLNTDRNSRSLNCKALSKS